jgi:hypothetical protein
MVENIRDGGDADPELVGNRLLADPLMGEAADRSHIVLREMSPPMGGAARNIPGFWFVGPPLECSIAHVVGLGAEEKVIEPATGRIVAVMADK